MNIFLVNQDNPVSKSLCEKLAGPKKPGQIIPLTTEEWDLYNSNGVQQIADSNENKSILTEVEPGLSYIAVCNNRTNIDDIIALIDKHNCHP